MHPDPFADELAPDLSTVDALIDELEHQAALLTTVATGGADFRNKHLKLPSLLTASKLHCGVIPLWVPIGQFNLVGARGVMIRCRGESVLPLRHPHQRLRYRPRVSQSSQTSLNMWPRSSATASSALVVTPLVNVTSGAANTPLNCASLASRQCWTDGYGTTSGGGSTATCTRGELPRIGACMIVASWPAPGPISGWRRYGSISR